MWSKESSSSSSSQKRHLVRGRGGGRGRARVRVRVRGKGLVELPAEAPDHVEVVVREVVAREVDVSLLVELEEHVW